MRAENGFTLLELLVAVALLAVLGLAAALTLNSGLRSQKVVGDALSSLQRLQLAQQLIQRDLEQVVDRRGRGERGDHRGQALMTGDNEILLDFYRTGRRLLPGQAPGSNLEHVRYRFRDGQLIRDSVALIDTPTGTPWHSVVLLENLGAVQLRFFHGGDWLDRWPPIRVARGATPRLPMALSFGLIDRRHGEVRQILLLPGNS
ncbi:MAG: type II secretion system minor pseudopilin GspJ [Oceanospirillaceae bacterium]|nr:type II secretion system minor pseudopilin GspJ [Oceanospirillaceae bacterium]